MENKIFNRLIVSYYVAFALFFVAFGVCFQIVKTQPMQFAQNTAIALQTIGIMYVMASVPFALWYFNRKVQHLQNDVMNKEKTYQRVALLRIALIAFGVILNVVLFCFLRNQSMIYCAAIAALAFVFCKPQRAKIEQDLLDEKTDEE